MNAKTGEQLIENNSKLAMTPASTMKIVTTSAALGMLGGSFRYETKLTVDGTFDSVKGIINGNLIIKGSGDPTLNSEYFKKKVINRIGRSLGKSIKEKGVKKITGKIIAVILALITMFQGNGFGLIWEIILEQLPMVYRITIIE